MKLLYLILNLASVSIPFLASFHPRLQFYRKWKFLFPSLVLSAIFYIIWDVLFTQNGVWGFNEAYFIGTKIASLPLEEILFFICIPYACVFSHFALLELFPKLAFPERYFKYTVYGLIGICLFLSFTYYDKWYTVINYGYGAILLVLTFKYNKDLLQKYLCTFVFMLIPFFIVNGILTGTMITDEVVWYNNDENLNIRMGTIPVEDITYAFTLILTNMGLMTYFEKRVK